MFCCEKQQDSTESKVCTEHVKPERQEEDPPDSTPSSSSSSPSSSRTDVKSTAVVKYEMVQMPVRFLELRPQTDLKQPPSNWLHGHSKWESYMQRASLSRDNPFSSFKMAHCFPELTGEIDAISDAENMKKLLKIPYSKAHVSMMVHRVGNTLLLDDFDIHKHLLRKQEADWRWLRRFYYETVVRNMADDSRYKCVLRKNKSRDHLQDRNMFSKFLYYSLADENVEERESMEEEMKEDIDLVETSVHFTDVPQSSPDPLPETEMGQLGHQRTVVWNFEDLHMLIGANLPIFGGGTHPCVSLRLRDMRKPINVLTGLDYWLDNLMCNVPELAMCYHLNGIVKNYELIKTEDIPNMAESQFSPKVVKDVAQNILSFLKSNATKEGHTYWLFKGHGDDIVKLYDLTTLSADCMAEDGSENPFTVPVGILLYRVARNIRKTGGRKKSGTIRTLLKNCIALLDKTLHPQIVTSAHYLLSDLYISDDIHNMDLFHTEEGSEFKDDDDPDEREGSEQLSLEEEKAASFVEVQALCWPEQESKGSSQKARERNELVRYPPVSGSQEERCREALRHIAEGLSCLHASLSEEETEDSKHKVETQAECNPSEAIPLHYEPLHPNPSQKATKQGMGKHTYSVNELSLLALSSMSHSTWHSLSKVLLLRKAAISYLGLARINLAAEKFGRALKYIKLALCSFASMSHMCQAKADENQELVSAIWGLSGDIHIMLTQHATDLEIHQEDFLQQWEEDREIWESARLELGSADFDWVGDLTSNAEDNLHRSVSSYRRALELSEEAKLPVDQVNVLMKRYGNVENELGVYYMNKAGSMLHMTDNAASSNTIQELWQRSFQSFEQGIEMFTRLKDYTNVALLHSNTGRLMRLCGQAAGDREAEGNRRQFSAQERHYLTQAQTHYRQALELLEKYHKNSKLTESVAWELSSSYFTMATLLQDYAPLSSFDQKTVEKEVTDLMMKALRHCNVDAASLLQQPTVQYRAATIHHRLASLYHNAYRNQDPHTTDQKRRHLRSLAELHYGKAYQLFLLLDNPCELLRVQLERVAMAEHQFANQTSVHGQLKPLHAALVCLLPLGAPVKSICTHIGEEADSGADFEGYVEEAGKLLGILASRLQFVLHSTIKTMLSAKKGKSFDAEVLSVFKKMYAASLNKCGTKDDGDVSLLTRCQHLLGVLTNIEKEYRKLPTTYHPG